MAPGLGRDAEPVPLFTRAADALLRWVKQQVFQHYRELVLPLGYQRAFEDLLQLLILPDWPLVIFTTNYDPMVEEFCRLAQGWTLSAGLINDAAVGEYYWSRGAYDGFKLEPGEKAIVLFKLHGSTTWVRQGRRILKSAATYTGDDKMCENIMIFPATRKVAIEDPYFTAYDYLEKCLRAAQLCLVIGYSFRDYDTLMRFKAAKTSNPNLQVCILDPQADELRSNLLEHQVDARPLRFMYGFQTKEYMEAIRKLVGKDPGQ